MNSYAAEFANALERTEKWNLRSVGSVWMDLCRKRDLAGITVPTLKTAREMSRFFPMKPAERAGDCAVVSARMLEFLLTINSPQAPVLTVGDVFIDGKPRYQVTEKSLEHMLRKGRSRDVMALHVWLTWPDLTVMDMVLPSTLALEAGAAPLLSHDDALVYFGSGSAEGGALQYRPWLVGEAFLERIGAFQPGWARTFDARFRVWASSAVLVAK